MALAPLSLATLGLRLVVELLGVGFVAYWGFTAADDLPTRIALAAGAAAVFVALWGRFLAPRATSGLTRPQKDVLGTAVLLLSAGALAAAGRPAAGLLYATVVLLNAVLLLGPWRRCRAVAPVTRRRQPAGLTRRSRSPMRLAPSLHRLGTSSLVNSYLVEDAGAVTVVDAGLPGMWKDLLAELDSMGRSPADVRALVLTHGDVDHIGFAERLRREYGVKVWVSEPDAPRARGATKKATAAGEPMRLGPMLRFLVYGASRAACAARPSRRSRRSRPARPWTCPARRESSPSPGTRRDRSPSTCRRSARSSWATPWPRAR